MLYPHNCKQLRTGYPQNLRDDRRVDCHLMGLLDSDWAERRIGTGGCGQGLGTRSQGGQQQGQEPRERPHRRPGTGQCLSLA
jgi:hypothetical protein